MQIDLTTFILEMINFVILVWLLNRFLYKPVQDIMTRRRAKIDQMVQTAKSEKEEANALRDQYEKQIEDWKKEQENAHAALTKELATAREKGMIDIRQAADKEQQRLKVSETKKQKDMIRQIEKRAIAQGMTFAAKFLTRLATPELDEKLVAAFLQDLDAWPDKKIQPLITALQEKKGNITVISAHEMSLSLQKLIKKTLIAKFNQKCKVTFSVDEGLVCGLRVTIGPWVLQANAKDELAFFVENPPHES